MTAKFHHAALDDLPGFETIAACARRIAQDSDPDALVFNPNPKQLKRRDELDDTPDVDELMRREGKGALRRRRTALQQDLRRQAGDDRPIEPAVEPRGWNRKGSLFNYAGPAKLDHDRALLQAAVDDAFGTACEWSGDFLYPPGAFRGWHTNRFDRPGWRMYIVTTLEARSSFFRYLTPDGRLETVWDQQQCANFFPIDPQHDFWHCIASIDTHRWSQGFAVPDDWAEILGLDLAF